MNLYKSKIQKLRDKKNINGLVKIIKNERNLDIQSFALNALYELNDNQANNKLYEFLNNEDCNIRNIAIELIGKFNNDHSNQILYEALKDNYLNVRVTALSSLSKINNVHSAAYLAKALTEIKDEFSVNEIINALIKHGVLAIEPLCRICNNNFKEIALNIIEKIGKEAIESLCDLIKDDDVNIRKIAIEAIVKIGIPITDPLYKIIMIEDKNIREIISEIIKNINNKNIEFLINCIKSKDYKIRSITAYALYSIKDINIVDQLIVLLDDKIDIVVKAAIYALGEIGDARVIKRLSNFLTKDDNEYKILAISAIGKIKQEESIKSLIEIFKDCNASVRKSIVEALGSIGGKDALDFLCDNILLKDEDNNQYIFNILKKIKKISPNILNKSIKENDIEKIILSIKLLGEIEDKESVETLLGYLKKDEISQIIKITIIQALGKIRDDRATDILCNYLNNKDINIQKVTIEALGKIRSSKAITPLTNIFNNLKNQFHRDYNKEVLYSYDFESLKNHIYIVCIKALSEVCNNNIISLFRKTLPSNSELTGLLGYYYTKLYEYKILSEILYKLTGIMPDTIKYQEILKILDEVNL